MKNFSRRQFLKQIASVAGFMLTNRSIFAFSQPASPADSSVFEMLVIGDSLVSAQGLSEKNKFYYLVKEWLQQEMLAGAGQVNLKVKAHAGSEIYLDEEEVKKYRQAGDDIRKSHYPEINLSYPDITAQIDEAGKEYESPEAVDLILLSGGINDISVSNIVNPFVSEKKIGPLIHKYCHEAMVGLLEHAIRTFPNARIAVIGYFPVVSRKSDLGKLLRFMLKIVKFPDPLRFFLTNPLSRQFMRILRRKMAKRSRFWVAESNRQFSEAVSRINARFDNPKVIFVETPVTEENCYGTKNSLLWEMDKNDLPNDERYNDRKLECPKSLKEINYHYYGKRAAWLCEMAAIGHPNLEGSKAYAEAIKERLKTFAQIRL